MNDMTKSMTDIKDIRGVGLQVSKLEGAYGSKLVNQKNSILPWLVSTSAEVVNRQQTSGLSKHGGQDSRRLSDGALGQPSSSITGSSKEMGAGLASFETGVRQSTSLPPLQDLDVAVIESLPPEVESEINDMYSGKLLGFISENKRKTSNSDIHAASTRSIEDLGVPVEDSESLVSGRFVESNAIAANSEVIRAGKEAPPNLAVLASFSVGNIMPLSLSEIDHSVLQQLPDEVRRDIIDLLPDHREPEVVIGAPSDSTDRQTEAVSEFNDLWIGNPPKWVEMFKSATAACSIILPRCISLCLVVVRLLFYGV